LKLLAEVCFETGIVDQRVSPSTVWRELRRMGIRWKRSKLWASSPDPLYAEKKARRDQLIEEAAKHPDWVLGFMDEVWWSRLERPKLSAWTADKPLKMHVLKADPDDPDPIAICCYGLLRKDTRKVMLRFAEDRPLSDVTIQFLDWSSQVLREEGKNKLIVIWDDASWHASQMVLHWLQGHNTRVRKEGGIELLNCELPVGSPWLNDIELCRGLVPFWARAVHLVLSLRNWLTDRRGNAGLGPSRPRAQARAALADRSTVSWPGP
jgi:hypothetical protein